MRSLFKKSSRQCLLVNRRGKRAIMNLIACNYPSISICWLLTIQIIKVTQSVGNVFWILSIKSTPQFKEELLLMMPWCTCNFIQHTVCQQSLNSRFCTVSMGNILWLMLKTLTYLGYWRTEKWKYLVWV